MTIRKMFPLLAVAMVAAASSPADVAGQISSCMRCVDSPFKPDPDDPDNNSTICQGWYSGRTECAQQGTPDYHLCLVYGPRCWDDVFAAADETAVEFAKLGQILPDDGDHFVLTQGDDLVVMRKCGAEIARLAISEVRSGGGHLGPLTIRPERSEHPDGPVAIADLTRGALEE